MLTNLSLVPYNETTSLIRQTADNIQMQVNDISIKIDNKKIVLDGNTEVNGSLTLTDEEQGFILKGGSGETYIQPRSIESYEAFSNKASELSSFMDNIKMQLKTTIEFGTTSYTYNGTYDCVVNIGEINKGTSLVFSNMKSSLKADDAGSVTYSISYKVYNGSSVVKSGSLSSQNITGNVFSYNAVSAGNYKVVFSVSASAIRSASTDNTGLVTNSIGATGLFSVDHYSPKDGLCNI